MQNFGGNFFKLAADYLRQRVKLNNYKSETVQLSSNLHKVSILGPHQIILFVKDERVKVPKCNFFGYSEESKLVATNTANKHMQLDLKKTKVGVWTVK